MRASSINWQIAHGSLVRLKKDCQGGIAIVFAVAFPIILAVVGMGIDYGTILTQKARLQAAADASALAAANQLQLPNTDKGQVQAVAKSVAKANLGKGSAGATINASISQNPLSVAVTVSYQTPAYFGAITGLDATELVAKAVARVVGGVPLCALGLGNHRGGTIRLERNATLEANGCAVYSNSTLSDSVVSQDGALLQAKLICSSGGSRGSKGNFDPMPLTDCPAIEDPLAARVPPAIGACTETNMAIGVPEGFRAGAFRQIGGLVKETLGEFFGKTDEDDYDDDKPVIVPDRIVTLKPGVYCGGLIIGGHTLVKLEPGNYVMKDGPLYVTDTAVLEGENVGFYMSGDTATLYLDACTTISLTAPKDGPLAGLLFYQDPNVRNLRTFTILSDNARVLLGTFYLPQGWFFIDSDRPIADKSAYTVIIANRLSLYAGPRLVLNSDYGATDVPLPDGVADMGGSVVLAE